MQQSQAKFWTIPVERHTAGGEEENPFSNYWKLCTKWILAWGSFAPQILKNIRCSGLERILISIASLNI